MARTKQTTYSLIPTSLAPLPPNTRAILRPRPEAVAYHIPISLTPSPLKTTISLPPNSTWTSGLHFHTTHTEYLHLLRGSIFLELNGSIRILSAEAGGEISLTTGQRVKNGFGLTVEVPRYARHNWGRAEERFDHRYFGVGERIERPADADDEVVVEEWTNPSDISKPLFFWNLNGIIATAAYDASLPLPQKIVKSILREWWIPFQLFVIFWELDNWPVLLSMTGSSGRYLGDRWQVYRYWERPVESFITCLVLFAANLLGWLIGVQAVEQGRTPDELWEAYKRHRI